MKKKVSGLIVTALLCGSGFLLSSSVSGHGHLLQSRAELCAKGENKNCGLIIYEPYSIEAYGGFPQTGPADGRLASGGIDMFKELDEQSATRWKKVDMQTGLNSFTWTLKVAHRTDDWRYYITKPNWDTSKPIKRSDLELIGRIVDGNKIPEKTVTHKINIPNDRTGYHIILAVWEIGDTPMAFYQVMDVNLTNGNAPNDTTPPTTPTKLTQTESTVNSISLSWQPSTDNIAVTGYEVLRNGKVVATTSQTSFTNKELTPDTAYTYTIVAVDAAGNTSTPSQQLIAKTAKAPAVDTIPPSKVDNVHSMGETTNTVELMWNAATDNVAIAGYRIYRNGTLVHTSTTTTTAWTDTTVQPDTTYQYKVEAYDTSNNSGPLSDVFSVTTKTNQSSTDTWSASAVYTSGAKVIFNGIEWKAKWWTQNERPGESDVWERVTGSTSNQNEWSASVAYSGGQTVKYNGNTYQAKWWTKGETPGVADVWKKVS